MSCACIAGVRGPARLLVVLFGAVGCAEPEPEPVRPAVTAVQRPLLAAAPAPQICDFEPVSSADARRKSGFELCYTPSEPRLPVMDPSRIGVAPSATALPAAPPSACPTEMVLVEGEYCPKPVHQCLRYLDAQAPGGFLRKHRCAIYERPASCAAPRQHRRFCMDRDEYAPGDGEVPLAEQSWHMAVDACEAQGKRLCFESEWQFACSGDELRPYPYGFERDAKRCNHDLMDLSKNGKLLDHRVASAERPDCVSPFGVRNLVGNVDEWTWRDGVLPPHRSSLRGGWWLAGRNNCIAATTAHDEYYHGPQTGFRCCSAAR
jgi:formylglycine-generating enzyme